MADFRTLLAQILGQQEEEQPNLAPRAPATQANTRGIFGRRPAGPPALGYADVAPMRPEWAERSHFQEIRPEPEAPHPFPFPMAGEQPQPTLRSRQPQAARLRVPNPESPGAYSNFADYANAQRGLRPQPMPAADREPWRQPVSSERWAAGSPSTGRGIEPPDAPQRREPAPFSMEDDAWMAARARAEQSVAGERRATGRRIPRPGNPLIAQAWSDPDRPGRRDGR